MANSGLLSKQPERLKVVSDRPWLVPVLLCLAGVLVMVALGLGFLWGSVHHRQQLHQANLRLSELKQSLQLIEERNKVLQQNVANFSVRAQLEQRASNRVREDVATLRKRIAELEEGLSFYRGIMEPSEARKGLTIGELKLFGRESREFEYRIVFQQLSTRHNLLKGSASVKIEGAVDGQQTTLALKDVSEDVADSELLLRFKYFQVEEGVITLPADFEPQTLIVRASSQGKQAQQIERTFPWRVMER